MITGIDHVVLLVPELNPAIENASTAGFTVTTGGKHDQGETHNALIPFRDGSYIELIAFHSGQPSADHYFARRHRLGPGLAELALRSTDIDRDVSDISGRGVPFPIPSQFGRHVPDGSYASWRMSLPAVLSPNAGYPFLMQDLTDRSIRVPGGDEATTHTNGAAGLAGVCMVVDDMAHTEPHFRSILNLPEPTRRELFPSGRGVRTLEISESGQWLAMLQPVADSAPQRHLERFGNSPYAIGIRTSPDSEMSPGEGSLLPVEQFHGARIFLQDNQD